MTSSLKHILLLFFIFSFSCLYGQSSGEDLFKRICSVCHTINKGKLIGPDLANVHKRRPMEWILKFVKSSQTMIKNKDKDAVTLFGKYNNIIMPDPNLSEEQIKTILNFIISISLDTVSGDDQSITATSQWKPLSEAGGHNVTSGEQLFEGNFSSDNPFKNGGPTCNSCHHVKSKAVMAGGTLAPELTKAFTKYNEAGLIAIINDPPFPIMKAAYQNNPLTEEEVYDLAAFLQYVDQRSDSQEHEDYGLKLLFPGLGALVLLFGFFSITWMVVKKRSVNDKIFDRQISSV